MIVDVTYLPLVTYSLVHHTGNSGVLVSDGYWHNYYVWDLASHLLRIAALGIASAMFFKSGPRIQALFVTSPS
jgi:hypothetical protein